MQYDKKSSHNRSVFACPNVVWGTTGAKIYCTVAKSIRLYFCLYQTVPLTFFTVCESQGRQTSLSRWLLTDIEQLRFSVLAVHCMSTPTDLVLARSNRQYTRQAASVLWAPASSRDNYTWRMCIGRPGNNAELIG